MNRAIFKVLLLIISIIEFESVFEDFLFGKILTDTENEVEFSLEDTKGILGY